MILVVAARKLMGLGACLKETFNSILIRKFSTICRRSVHVFQ